ncbi:MAG: hypothetical protein FD153_1157 [Rhodospirillaceae bacterium]|nr:MAG: hypothetical protein FD153_1157 [Rhodospirillaceae bacterium]
MTTGNIAAIGLCLKIPCFLERGLDRGVVVSLDIELHRINGLGQVGDGLSVADCNEILVNVAQTAEGLLGHSGEQVLGGRARLPSLGGIASLPGHPRHIVGGIGGVDIAGQAKQTGARCRRPLPQQFAPPNLALVPGVEIRPPQFTALVDDPVAPRDPFQQGRSPSLCLNR